MHAFFICLVFWLAAIIGETSIFPSIPWFQPNLFFLASSLFCLRWRGHETSFIALIFGLTADCFSTVPFGTYAMVYFLFSFPVRGYAIKIYQLSRFTLPWVVILLTLIANILIMLMLTVLFNGERFSGWLVKVIWHEVIPTAVLSVPVYSLLRSLEKKYKVRLAERKF